MNQESLLQENELLIFKVRKHFLIYVGDAVLHFFGCLLLLTIAHVVADIPGIVGSSSPLLLYGCVLIFFTSFFYSWTKDYFDTWFITDMHIVAVNQRSLLDREISYMEYSRIQDVFFEKEGLLQTVFGYGRLKIQTAGTENVFSIDGVSSVEDIVKRIIEIRDKKR